MKPILKILFVLIITFIAVFPVKAQCWFSQLLDDAAKSSNTEFTVFVRNNDNAFVAYEVIYNARGAGAVMKTDPALLTKVSELLNDSEFLRRIGGQAGLEDVIKANVRAGCSVCGTPSTTYLKNIDEYLDDVHHFVNNYNEVPGFDAVIAELKKTNMGGSPNYAMEGASFMIDNIRKRPDITPSSVSKFDGQFEGEIEHICVNCRFDIEMNDGTKIEYKSYSETSINRIPTSSAFLKQHLSYLAETDDIGKINYVFDAKKFNNRNKIMEQFQTMYQKNIDDVFDVIWNNQSLRNSLFDNRNNNAAKNYFRELVQGSDNNRLYNFIISE